MEHNFEQDILQRITVDRTVLLMPCKCQEATMDSNQTNVSSNIITVTKLQSEVRLL